MTAIDKAQQLVADGKVARACATDLQRRAVLFADTLTRRTVCKARQGRIAALNRIVRALDLRDDPPEAARNG